MYYNELVSWLPWILKNNIQLEADYDIDPVDTGRKLNVHKTSWTSSERLMYVQFTSCVYGGVHLKAFLSRNELSFYFMLGSL